MQLPRPTPRRAQGENVIALINIVFLLLIFFMLTARFMAPDPVPLDLPQALRGDPAGASEQRLVIDRDGDLYLDGEALPHDALAQRIDSERPVTLRADRALSGPELVRVLERLRGAGVPEVFLIARSEP